MHALDVEIAKDASTERKESDQNRNIRLAFRSLTRQKPVKKET